MKKHLNAGNFISILRIPLGIIMLYGIINEDITTTLIAFLIGISTDALDGYVARKTNKVSKLGAILDPVCDRFFILMGIIGVLYLRTIPLEFLVLFFSRELIQLVLLLWMKASHSTLSDWKAHWPSKITSNLQYITIIWIFFQWQYSELLFVAIGILGIISGLMYFQRITYLPR